MFPMFTSMCLTMQITFLHGQVRNIFQPKVKTDTFESHFIHWTDPYLLMLKKEVDSLPDGAELWAKSTVKKSPPILISHDEMSITTIFDKLLDLSSVNFENRNENETLKEVAPEVNLIFERVGHSSHSSSYF